MFIVWVTYYVVVYSVGNIGIYFGVHMSWVYSVDNFDIYCGLPANLLQITNLL